MHNRLTQPLERKKPTMYFVNSMSDLFHEKVPYSYIDQVMEVISLAQEHTFQILTKRSSNMETYFSSRRVPDNAWLGASVEDKQYGKPRIANLQRIRAKTRFLSIEPLLEDVGRISLRGIHWVIVGGESGAKARPMNEAWVMKIQNQCLRSGTDFFFKQWGSWGRDGVKRSKQSNGRQLNGRTWNEIPAMAI